MTVADPGKRLSLAITVALLWPVASCGSAEPTIGVLTLHGVGSQRQGVDFDAKLRRELHARAGPTTRIVVGTVYYHGASRDRQAALWQEFGRLEDKTPSSLDHRIIRRQLLMRVGDALAYANDPTATHSFYRAAQGKVRNAVDRLNAELGENRPIAVVAHSLGCKVIFDYICDAQAGQGIWEGEERPSAFQQLANLRLLITTGCNLPFFESATPATEHRFFRVNEGFRWINFYDRDDVLGWPLRPLGGRFREVVQDEERNRIGSSLTSHFNYWQDDKLNKEIAGRILELARGGARRPSRTTDPEPPVPAPFRSTPRRNRYQ